MGRKDNAIPENILLDPGETVTDINVGKAIGVTPDPEIPGLNKKTQTSRPTEVVPESQRRTEVSKPTVPNSPPRK